MNKYLMISTVVCTLQACHPPDGHGNIGWPGDYTPQIGEPCEDPGEFRCAYPREDSRAVLTCQERVWTISQVCRESATCNWAAPLEAYCASP